VRSRLTPAALVTMPDGFRGVSLRGGRAGGGERYRGEK
jgi:hypothetical protein